ncbi:MAG: cbb3-type cytochrome oxidase assembly protein CcoS [Xanthomonadales bacterium]|nr:cbb3-type cytochrome oxidase assembly protein CcoS [Xanthomonadales bacterium]
MEIIYVLIPLSILLMLLAIGAFFWAVRNDQFDDLDTPALDILDDDDKPSGGKRTDGRDERAGGKKDQDLEKAKTRRREERNN